MGDLTYYCKHNELSAYCGQCNPKCLNGKDHVYEDEPCCIECGAYRVMDTSTGANNAR